MRARARSWRLVIGESFWFIPTVTTLLAAALAIVLVWLDSNVRFDLRQDLPWWLFGGGPDGVRDVLSTIASTTITVTGVVFSITIVAIQLASSQFSPLVLRTFRANRGNQIVLGFFIAAFSYSILVLRSVLPPTEQHEAFTLVIAASGSIGLMLVCVALLSFFIHHAARSMQASAIVDRAFKDTMLLIDTLFPEEVGDPAPSVPSRELPEAQAAHILATQGGYFQAVDRETLFDLSEDRTLTVQVVRVPGDYILPGSVLALVWPGTNVDEGMAEQVRDAFLIGPERTLQSDVELGLRQISDMAIKALSPGINDPTTAMLCIDHLSGALVHLGRRHRPPQVRTGGDGDVRVVLLAPPFEHLVDVAVAQIRHYGASDATLAAHLASTLGRITAMVLPERRNPFIRHARLVVENARASRPVGVDIERVEHAASWLESLDHPDAAHRGAYALPSSDREVLHTAPS